MKRSEMIQLIADEIPISRDFLMLHSATYYAEQILTKMERAGMLPPKMEGVYDPVPTVTPTGNLDYGWARGWEKE